MKHTILTAAFFIACLAAQAQTDTTKLYEMEKLQLMGKQELTGIYLNQVTHLLKFMPRTALNSNDVPTNKFTGKHWESIDKSITKTNAVYMEMYKDLIPYADKENLIDGILWLQEVTLQMESI